MNDPVRPASPDPLFGKRLLFLGSSVTYGSAANGVSFVDCLAERHGCLCRKEAVSGTTLCDDDKDSYVSRLFAVDPSVPVDALLVQLSTNDAWMNKPVGTIAEGFDPASFDPHTVAGAIETILARAKALWGCPVVFCTGTRFQSAPYAEMVALLGGIQRKWGFTLLDLFYDPEMNAVSPADYARYMKDPVHPTLEGYREWWTPKFSACLTDLFFTQTH